MKPKDSTFFSYFVVETSHKKSKLIIEKRRKGIAIPRAG